jgi:hypothetical protein
MKFIISINFLENGFIKTETLEKSFLCILNNKNAVSSSISLQKISKLKYLLH